MNKITTLSYLLRSSSYISASSPCRYQTHFDKHLAVNHSQGWWLQQVLNQQFLFTVLSWFQLESGSHRAGLSKQTSTCYKVSMFCNLHFPFFFNQETYNILLSYWNTKGKRNTGESLAESSLYTLISDNIVLAQLDLRNIENSQQKRLKQENTDCPIRISPEKKACDCLGLYTVEKYLPCCLQPHPRRSCIKKKKKSTIRKTCLQRVILAVTGLFRKVFGKIARGMRIHILYHHLGIHDYKGWLLSQFTIKAT